MSDMDNKEALFVKEEATNDAEVFGEVVVDVEGSLFGFVCAENRPLTWFLPFFVGPVERLRGSLTEIH